MAYSSWNGNLVTRPAKGIFGRIINLLVQVRDRADSRQDVFRVPAASGGAVVVHTNGGTIAIQGSSGGKALEVLDNGSVGFFGNTATQQQDVAAGASVADLITALDTAGIINKT